MDSRNRILVVLIFVSLMISAVTATEASSADSNLDSSKKIEKRSGFYGGFHGGYQSGLSYTIPSAPAYGYAKQWIAPYAKYPVIKPLVASVPVLHHHKPHYALHHGGASVTSFRANYPRYPVYKPVYKVPVQTFIKPTVFTSPAFVYPQKPVIPIAVNRPIVPTAANPVFIQRPEAFKPSVFAGLNPQLIPVAVSQGAVFTNVPTYSPAPIQPSWRPIVVPSTAVATTIPVQRPSVSILPPFVQATVATPQDHGHHHHHVVSSTAASSSLLDAHQHYDHHQHLFTGQGEVADIYHQHHHSAPSGSAYVGPSSYDVDIHQHQQQQQHLQEHQQHQQLLDQQHHHHQDLYHNQGGYQ